MSSLNKEYKEERLTLTEGIQISERFYNLTIGLVVLYGLLLNFLVYRLFGPAIINVNYYVILILYFAGAFGGTFIIYKNRNPLISLLGFTILALAMGMLLCFALSFYRTDLILNAIAITGITTGVMMLLAVIFPSFFLSLGRALGITLLVCIGVELVCAFLLRMNTDFMDWIVALLFCGYIGYDWAKAQQYPKTLDNAVDSAADIYVDVVNLFLRILSILSRSKRND